MILVDVLPLAAMAIMMLIALARGATSVSHRELWNQPPRPAVQPHFSPTPDQLLTSDHMVNAA